jgi:Flp pilus assembly protein TadD
MCHFMRGLRTLAVVVLVLAAPFGIPSAQAARDSSLDALFDLLKKAKTAAEAQNVEGAIWVAWMHSGDVEADSLMQLGTAAIEAGDPGSALAVFDKLVTRRPDFAEAWNKRATVHYMMGNFAASVVDIQRTLALEPRHFGALSGLGLIYDALGKERPALRAFEAALRIHPRLPGARSYVEAVRQKTAGLPI